MKIELSNDILKKDLRAIARLHGVDVSSLAEELIALSLLRIRNMVDLAQVTNELAAGEQLVEGSRKEYRRARDDYRSAKSGTEAYRNAGGAGSN